MTDVEEPQRLSKEEVVEGYHHLLARKVVLLVVCIIGIVLVAGLLSLSVYPNVSLPEAYGVIWGHITGHEHPPRTTYWWADRYIWNRALPHIIIAIVGGASLAVCGALMQALMSNPLADPYSTGISSGACFGAVMSIIIGFFFAGIAGEAGLVTNAFLGALIPAIIIIVIANFVRVTPATLILMGAAISYFFNALITYAMVITDADTLQSAYMWQIGSLDGLTWDDVPIMLAITIVGSALIIAASSKLNVMSLGDKSAVSLGVDANKFRILCMILLALMTASVIAFTGIIGFVGLVAPHLVRLVIGSDNKFVVPISMAVGALILLIADYISFVLTDIPLGIVMSIIGSPVFFALIVWQRKGTGAIY